MLRRPSLGALSLTAGLLALAVSLGIPARAASLGRVVFAQHARNADAVDGISASRRPKHGFALALGRRARYPRKALRTPIAGAHGPSGAQGSAGSAGAAGTAGPVGLAGAMGTRGASGAAGAAGPNGSFVPTAAGGDLAGSYLSPALALNAADSAAILNGSIVLADLAPSLSDAAPGTASLRSLGTGARQAAAGNDARLSDARTPTGGAHGALAGSYPAPSIAAGGVTAAALGGNAALWARVSASGALLAGRGVTDTSRSATGSYVVQFAQGLGGCGVIATNNEARPGHIIRGLVVTGGQPGRVLIGTFDGASSTQNLDLGFTVKIVC